MRKSSIKIYTRLYFYSQTLTGLVGLETAGGECPVLPECHTQGSTGGSHYLMDEAYFKLAVWLNDRG